MDEYNALADEMGRVVALVDGLNQSLDDACRRRAKRTPSNLLSDFLDRLAYTVGAGQPVADFLTNEQEGFIKKFVVRYESDLRKLDVLKEMYVALMLAVSFVLVFATVIPILIDVSPVLLVVGVVSMFCVLQSAFLVLVNSVSPTDPLWCSTEERGSPLRRVWKEVAVGFALTAVTVPVAYLGITGVVLPETVPRPIWIGVGVTPLVLPGLKMRQEGKKVQKRDEDFSAFIRALGSVESVKQSSTASVLESLRRKDFGELTDSIESLYRRLNVRVDSERAWSLFAAETGSYLIHKFGDMYVTGRRMGGDPETLGLVISENFEEVVRVREQRAQATMTFVGVLYGITAAVVFASFVGFEITKQMVSISEGISDVDFDTATALFNSGTYNVGFIELLLLLFVLLNAFFSSVAVRLIDRRHPVSGLVHFVALCWIGAVVATLTKLFVGPLMGV
jgi:flagellar protein FlaJ